MTAQSYHTNAAEIAHTLDRHPKKSGDWWRVPCPAHNGVKRSFAIADGDAPGALRVACHSEGCSSKKIYDTLRAMKLISPVRQWTYPNGKVVTRTDSPEGDKDFQSEGSPKDTPLLVFSDDGLSPIVVCEGEADAQSLDDAMFTRLDVDMRCGASYSHGAGSAHLADYAIVEGRAVVVWPDFDDAGRKAGKAVADACQLAGAISISFVADGVEGAADLSPDAIIAALENVTRTYPQVLGMTLRQIAQLPPITYLIDGFLTSGRVTALVGKPKDGKSQLVSSMLAENFRHGTWLGKPTKPIRCLYLCEMDPESSSTISPPPVSTTTCSTLAYDMFRWAT